MIDVEWVRGSGWSTTGTEGNDLRSPAQVKWHVGYDDVRLEQKRALDEKGALVVEEMVPPASRNELGEKNRDEIIGPLTIDLLDVLEQRLEE